ncbi:membrane protein insertion efficiency factor YidD [Enterococcus sp. 22-H-5-01]|uniref:membrane protein insertion efficiency factor YidD n=1 Tax=Enterococcus sp. 22-H-5-01 TaxID=3418555 RepID=UPI003CFBE0E8
MNLIGRSIIFLVRGYQRFISPLFPPSCRYYPSCSSYMIKAVQVHGAPKGFLMGISRILRCQPFAKGGLDYVPTTFSLRKNKIDQEEPKYPQMNN